MENGFSQSSTMLIRIPSNQCLLLKISLLVHTNLLFEIEFLVGWIAPFLVVFDEKNLQKEKTFVVVKIASHLGAVDR